MAESIDRGDTRRLTLTVSEGGTPTTPTALTLTLIAPDGTATTYTLGVDATIVQDAPGVFHADIVLDQAGLWAYDWRATSPDQVQGGELSVGLPATEHVAAYLFARSRIARLTAAGTEPVLDQGDLDELARKARRPDTTGLPPAAADWASTYDLDAAVADGWEIKAGRAAAGYDFGEDSQRFNRSQIHDQCMAMARLYRRGSGSVRVPSVAAG
jgi:hypothetical protein